MKYSSSNLDIILREVSDHQPIIHHGAFFWNIMMQGNLRLRGGYNNAFGLIEDECAYSSRLMKIAEVIARLVKINPEIEFITLCEGPIKPEHVKFFFLALKQFPVMASFTTVNSFYRPNSYGQNWGLLMLVNFKYCVDSLDCGPQLNGKLYEIDPKLVNRFQLWKLTDTQGEYKYLGLAHFPFVGDEGITSKIKLSASSLKYCEFVSILIEHFSDEKFLLCADFNFNPYLIGRFQDHRSDQIPANNSVLLTPANSQKSVTVDGILLSQINKQIYEASKVQPLLHHHRLFNNKELHTQARRQKEEQESRAAFPHSSQLLPSVSY